ncbi:LacI family DNA-binding transcriptional regulator [Periweissella fabalis]|uniref:LacI family transcriptional regulator n=1 Tax=Periweissella fabalis TaxID=1070421 RepID=A0A7X6N274_9LACO|nr:LacI family DNA-binding transcriptional regulator [Periweissella fabalis]MCM0599057.1 LacI family DNA-binding transcriptional regulator [Periweissella fabalis]NKZ23337.1 LacI family transcriptional regulator [Periweissella fabalis]
MVSMRDVAQHAGVSVGIVSRVFNQDPTLKITIATRQRVLTTAQTLGFRHKPRKLQRGSKTSREKQIYVAVITSYEQRHEVSDPYFLALRNGLAEGAQNQQIHLDYLFTLHSDKKPWDELTRYDAVILIGTFSEQLLATISTYNKHLVIIDDHRELPNYDVVHNDFYYQTICLLEHLYHQGHRKIAFLGVQIPLYDCNGNVTEWIKDVRQVAYDQWMEQKKMPQAGYCEILTTWEIQAVIKSTHRLMNLPTPPTAIITSSDPIAIILYNVLNENGWQIPEQVSVVSFDDIEYSRFLIPSLTTIQPNTATMSKVALRLIMEQLNDQRQPGISVEVASQLIERHSVIDLN